MREFWEVAVGSEWMNTTYYFATLAAVRGSVEVTWSKAENKPIETASGLWTIDGVVVVRANLINVASDIRTQPEHF